MWIAHGGSRRAASGLSRMAETADVELIAVVKRYGGVTAVDGIALKIPARTYCCLLGPSGCGKTTTLRLIAGHEAPERRRHPDRRHGRQRPAAGASPHCHDVPELRPVPAFVLHRQRRFQPQDAPRRQARTPGQGDGAPGARADGRLRRAPAGPALRRPAATRGPCPRAGHQPQRPAPGRAALGARSVPARAHARRAEAPADRARHQLRPRHPQPGGGDGARRPGGGHERRPDRAARCAPGSLQSAGHRLRRPLHRRPQRTDRRGHRAGGPARAAARPRWRAVPDCEAEPRVPARPCRSRSAPTRSGSASGSSS